MSRIPAEVSFAPHPYLGVPSHMFVNGSRLIRALVLVAFIRPAVAVAGPAEDQYSVAAAHYSQGRWELARDEFRRYLADYSDHDKANRALFYLAESLVQLRDFDEAAAKFREFLEKAPLDRLAGKALFRAGEASYLAGDFEDAELDLKSFRESAPNDALNAYALPYLGDLALRHDDPAAAEQLFDEGLKRFPQGRLQDDCRFGLARACEAQGNRDHARRLYLALASKPQSAWAAEAQFRLGASFFDTREYEAAYHAFAAFDQAFADSELKGQANLAAAKSLYYLKRYQEAQALLARLHQDASGDSESTNNLEATYWLGLTQKANGDWDAAADTLLEGIAGADGTDAQPLLPALRYHAGDALLHAGKVKQANEQFQTVLTTWPEGEFADDSSLGKIQAALADGRHAEIERLEADFLDRYKDSPLRASAIRTLVRSQLARKHYAKALESLEALTALVAAGSAPDNQADEHTSAHADTNLQLATDRHLLTVAYLGLERYEEALKAVDEALAECDREPNADRELKNDALRARATALMALGKFAEAISPFETYLAASQASAATWTRGQLALCYAHENRFDDAKQIYRQFLADAPQSELLLPTTAGLAESLLAQAQYAGSAELFESLISDANPTAYVGRGLSGLGWCQFKLGELDAASATFDRLLATAPEFAQAPEAALTRGRILEQLGKPDDALGMYRLVIEKYSTTSQLPQGMLLAARLDDRLGHDDEADQLFARLDAEFPEHPEHEAVLYDWAWVLVDLKKTKEADAIWQRLRTIEPRSRYWADATYRLAERALQAKDFDSTGQLLDDLVASETDQSILPHALYLQAQLNVAQEQWAEAVGPLERLIHEFPQSPLRLLAKYWRAEAAYCQSQFDRAGELFEQVEAAAENRQDKWLAMVPLRRAQVLVQQKKWPEALELAVQIEAKYPDFEQQYEVDYVIGRCLASQGKFDDAREHYQEVVRSEAGAKTETAAMAQWMIGEAYFHQREYRKALREYLRVEILYDFPTWRAAALVEAAKCHELLDEWKEAAQLYARLLKEYPGSSFVDQAKTGLQQSRQRASQKIAKGKSKP